MKGHLFELTVDLSTSVAIFRRYSVYKNRFSSGIKRSTYNKHKLDLQIT